MIDIGVNLTHSRFDKDRDALIERAKNTGIKAMLVTGTNVEESHVANLLCQKFPYYLYSTAGVHPHDADNVSDDYLDALRVISKNANVKAIGECGLDFNRNFSAPKQQEKVFSEQVHLASELGLPLFLHQRDAFEPWYNILSPYFNKVPAMVSHCFTGNKDQLEKCLQAGMYIGITGWICDERRGQELRDIVKYIPIDKLLIETDAPFLTPRNIKPRPKSSRNEPSYLPYIVKSIASLMGLTDQALIEQSHQNSINAFNLGKCR